MAGWTLVIYYMELVKPDEIRMGGLEVKSGSSCVKIDIDPGKKR